MRHCGRWIEMTVTHGGVAYVLRTAADVVLFCALFEQLESLAAGKAA